MRHNRFMAASIGSRPAATPVLEGNYAKLAAIAQVLMLVLVGFGYWYTVLPVYQKSLLDEEIAKKTIELNSATTELTTLRNGIHEKESELASLQHSINAYKNDSRQARSDATKAKHDSAVAQQDAAEKYSTLRSQSLGLFWGEIVQQCVGDSISNDEKLMQCIETRAKTSRSYSQLEPGDGVAVLQKIRASVEKTGMPGIRFLLLILRIIAC